MVVMKAVAAVVVFGLRVHSLHSSGGMKWMVLGLMTAWQAGRTGSCRGHEAAHVQ